MLVDFKKADRLSQSTYKSYSSDGLCPRFYGLPKIFKYGIPLCPMVSFVNSTTYVYDFDFSRGRFYRLLIETKITRLRIPACECPDFIRGTTLDASLFTKIPVDLATKVAERGLTEDASLGQRTS